MNSHRLTKQLNFLIEEKRNVNKKYIPGQLIEMTKRYSDYYEAHQALKKIIKERRDELGTHEYSAIKQSMFFLEQKMVQTLTTHS